MPRTTVFISYARVDIARVREIVEIVRAAGYDPWFDHRLLPGQNWKRELLRTIRECDLFLYALSPDSVKSEWCLWEFRKAVELNRPVVPVLLHRNTPLEPPLSDLHYADFCDGPSYITVAELIGGLRFAETIPPEHAPAAPENPQGTPIRARTGEFSMLTSTTQAVFELDTNERWSAPDAAHPDVPPTHESPLVQTWERLPFEPETVLIPQGPFLMGSTAHHLSTIRKEPIRKWVERTEIPQQVIQVSDYRIGRYPVTVGEFRVFVESGGYAEYVKESEQTLPDDEDGDETSHAWESQPWAGDDRLPVVSVSWYEAVAYARWLSDITGRCYRLPTEAEWEKAARGTDGMIYPWGKEWRDGVCNTRESRIGRTTPVGRFSPQGDSPFGVADMAGNVWEWCGTKWQEIYNDDTPADFTGSGGRVVRGGSWSFTQYQARTTFRQDWLPYCRLTIIGFRVALVSIARD